MKSAASIATLALVLGGLAGQPADAADTACGKPMTQAQKARLALDIAQVQNAASLHEYYHNAWDHASEYANAWAQHTPGVTWTNNTDRYVGAESFKRFYVDGAKSMPSRGVMAYHMLTTPVIEVAGDGQTAKGIWMSFGDVSGSMGGQAMSVWTQEKYGIDFVKEDGQWKIWHLRTYVDFYSPTGKSWTDPSSNLNSPQNEQAPPPPPGGANQAGVQAEPGASFQMAAPDEKGTYYEGYHPGRIPTLAPELPRPYCHFSETFAY